MSRISILAILLPAIVAIFALMPIQNKEEVNFHSPAELSFFKAKNLALGADGMVGVNELEIDSNILFPTGKVCGGCHGKDLVGNAMTTTSGVDINIYDDWRSTMMANSAKDPFWRAKVTHEILVNPAHSLDLQTKCTSCHAPMGHYQAKLHDNKPFYLLSDLYNDTLGLDGVSCQMCHAQAPEKIGTLHSGELNFDTNRIRVAYGPYEFVFAPPMHQFVGITPVYGEHIADAGLCAGCHTLITGTVDLDGAYTGSTFVEQATYHEWLNSRYDKDHDNISCQGCHIPKLFDAVVIASNYQNLTPKFPYGLHEMAGANVTMLKLMKKHRNALGINALPEHFDSTISATLRMLQEKTLDLSIETLDLNGDTAHFGVIVNNKAGHKFPSGYPSRRAWIEFEVRDSTGNVIFHSGKMNSDYTLVGEDSNYEPHHQYITNPGQVQIYELVPGDVNSMFTNVLERGHLALKDNRLTPQGFSKLDVVYDTTQVVGIGNDLDFNRNADGTEGSGTDITHYKIAINGYTGPVTINSKIWYQSLPLKWMMPMFAYSSPEIDSFKTMFDNADNSPILIAEKTLSGVYISPVKTGQPSLKTQVSVWPTLTNDGLVSVSVPDGTQIKGLQIYSANGTLVWDRPSANLLLPMEKGIYFIAIQTNRGKVVKKVIRG
jgi:Cytochrome c554 and c-prime